MKKILLIALAGLMTLTAAVPALALGPLDIEAELPVYSKYVWRGMNLANDWVLQPNFDISVFGFNFNFWGNMNLSDVNGTSGEFDEINYNLSYTLGLPLIELGAGFLHYYYPNNKDDNTTEFFLSAKASVILSPALALYQDIDRFKGAYWGASIGHGFTLGETTQLDLTGGLGLGSKGFIAGYFAGQTSMPDNDLNASLNDAFLLAEIPFHPIPFFTVAPSVKFTTLLGDAKKAVDGNDNLYSGKKTNVIWGLAARFNF